MSLETYTLAKTESNILMIEEEFPDMNTAMRTMAEKAMERDIQTNCCANTAWVLKRLRAQHGFMMAWSLRRYKSRRGCPLNPVGGSESPETSVTVSNSESEPLSETHASGSVREPISKFRKSIPVRVLELEPSHDGWYHLF